MKKLVLTFLLLASTTIVFCQADPVEEEPRLRKNAISFSFFGPTPILGITYERILAKKLSIEIGFGLPSVGLGLKLYPHNVKVDKPMFTVGVSATYFASQESEMTPAPTFLIYIPFGVSVFRKKGFNFAFDFGPGYAYDRFVPYGNLRFGYRF